MGRNLKDAMLVCKAAGSAALTFTALGIETIGLNRVTEKCFAEGKDISTKVGLIGLGAIAVYLPLSVLTFTKGTSWAAEPITKISFKTPETKDTTE